MDAFFQDYLDRLDDFLNQLLGVLDGLDEEALDWQPGPEMNTLGVLVTHTLGATRFWIAHIALGQPTERVRAEEFEVQGLGLDELRSGLEDLRRDAHRGIPQLKLESLSQMRRSDIHSKEFSVSWSLLHALEHLALHVGHAQVTRQLWDMKDQ
ncbi:DinB family protein [Chloroflexota bacterium]